MIAYAALALAVATMALDWWAVARDRRHIEAWAKPLVMVLLIIAALAMLPASEWVRAWIVVGLIFGLLGDVLLFKDRFVPGAAAFMVGHLAYVVALLAVPHPPVALAFGLVVVMATAIGPGRCIVRGAWWRDRTLGIIVAAYMLVIGIMTVLAVGSYSTLVGVAALLFLLSDSLLGWGRFVGPATGGRVVVMITYQLAQLGFVLALPTLAVA